MAGAPRGNQNALRHGAGNVGRILEADRPPKGCGYILRGARTFRMALEAAVVERHGQISIPHAAAIHSAMRAETRARLLARWLREAAALDPKAAEGATGPLEATVEAVETETVPMPSGKTKTITRRVKKGLSIEQRQRILADIANATEQRDRAIARLRLDDEPAHGGLTYIDALTAADAGEPDAE